MTKKRDLEAAVWELIEQIGAAPLEEVDRRLKALDLLVKIRVQGPKVKPDTHDDAMSNVKDMVKSVVARQNGGDDA